MHNIQHISFPRSGHHLLARCLRGVLPDMIYYCEFYKHCKQTPCTDPKTNYQKNHDLDLKLKPVSQFHYIVQYRHPIQSIVSWYEMRLSDARPIEKLLFIKDSEKHWRKFCLEKIRFWQSHVQKWIFDNNSNNVLFVSYHDLLNNPIDVLNQTAYFICPEKQLNQALVERVVAYQDIAVKRFLTDFRYYDPVFFTEIEDSIEKYLTALNLRRVVEK